MNILLVDDDVDLSEMISDFLTSKGFQVSCCANGREGMDRLSHAVPDLVLLDGLMPVLDGLGMLEEMRGKKELLSVPVILMSADTPHGPQSQYLWTAYIQKPIHFNKLLDEIRRILEK
jgi:two-component system response regulator CpxR